MVYSSEPKTGLAPVCITIGSQLRRLDGKDLPEIFRYDMLSNKLTFSEENKEIYFSSEFE